MKSLIRFAFSISLLFVLQNALCQVKQELPHELLSLTGMLSKPLVDLKNNLERPISQSDVPARTFSLYETGFFILRQPDSICVFGSEIRKIMISIDEDSTVNGVFVTLSKQDAFLMTASEKLGAENGRWRYESSFGSSELTEDLDHIWNIGHYILSIYNSNDYDGTPVDDKDQYVITLRRKLSI